MTFTKLNKNWLTGLTLISLFGLVSCMNQQEAVRKALNSQNSTGGGSSGGGNVAQPYAISAMSVKHGNSLLPALAIYTGVTDYLSRASITTATTSFRQALSASGSAMGYTTQMSLAHMALVTAFCREASLREATLTDAQRTLYPGVVLNQAMPATGFTAAQIENLVQVAWRRFRGDLELSASLKAMLVQQVNALYASLPAGAGSNTTAAKGNVLGARSVAEAGCIMIGSAFDSLSNDT